MIVGNNDMIEQDLLILSSIKFAYQAKESHVGKDIGHGNYLQRGPTDHS
jgi:hypothetical protein